MITAAVIFLSLVGALALYMLAGGLSFALMYRLGTRYPAMIASAIFEPLEALCRQVPALMRLYNAVCVRCYKWIVGGPLYGGWPPPPPSLGG
jgi:hypothetical protein